MHSLSGPRDRCETRPIETGYRGALVFLQLVFGMARVDAVQSHSIRPGTSMSREEESVSCLLWSTCNRGKNTRS